MNGWRKRRRWNRDEHKHPLGLHGELALDDRDEILVVLCLECRLEQVNLGVGSIEEDLVEKIFVGT
jgi:hypothetical protein